MSVQDDMPDEDHLGEALLETARALGQCPDEVDGWRCTAVAGHTGDHYILACGVNFQSTTNQGCRRAYLCEREAWHDGPHAVPTLGVQENTRNAVEDTETTPEARSGTTQQKSPCPDVDHMHGCYAEACRKAEAKLSEAKRCPPACNCPPGTHAQVERNEAEVKQVLQAPMPDFVGGHSHWFVRNNVELLAEDRINLDHAPDRLPRPSVLDWRPGHGGHVKLMTDEDAEPQPIPCAGCPSDILPGVKHTIDMTARVGEDGTAPSYHLGCWASLKWHEARNLPFPPVRGQGDGKALQQAAKAAEEEAEPKRGWGAIQDYLAKKGVPYKVSSTMPASKHALGMKVVTDPTMEPDTVRMVPATALEHEDHSLAESYPEPPERPWLEGERFVLPGHRGTYEVAQVERKGLALWAKLSGMGYESRFTLKYLNATARRVDP